MFKVGDAVFHPGKGAGIVTEIRRMPALNQKSRYYKIKLVDRRIKTMLMVPIKRADKVGLRPVIDETNLEEVWETLSSEPQELPDAHKKRYKLTRDKLRMGDVTQAAEVVRDFTWRRIQVDKLNAPGQRIYKKALRMLTSEVAASQEIAMQRATEQIERRLNENFKGRSV